MSEMTGLKVKAGNDANVAALVSSGREVAKALIIWFL